MTDTEASQAYPWTPGPWLPSPHYAPAAITKHVDAQQYVARDGVTRGPYVEASGPDRALIVLADEMAEAILACTMSDREFTDEKWDGAWRALEVVADKLRAIGAHDG